MELKEAINEVFIEGILKEKTLELAVVDVEDANGGKKKADVIRGELIITTTENSEHKVRVNANKITKEGKDNSVYKGLVTVMDEYVSIAEGLKKHKGEGKTEEEALKIATNEATKVRITKGKLGLNEYYANVELKSFPSVSTNFVNRLKDGDTYNPKAEFSLEAYFDSITPEVKNGEETGRLVIKVIVPIYGGKVVPFTLIATDEDIVNYIQSNYEKGKTGKIWGELVNTVEVTKTIEQGFGKSKEKVVTKTINELIVTGGEEDQYDEDSDKSYSTDLIKRAMAEREIALDEKLKKSKNGDKKSSGGSNNNSSSDKPKKKLNF